MARDHIDFEGVIPALLLTLIPLFITYTLATKLDVSGPCAEVVAGLLVCPLKGGPP